MNTKALLTVVSDQKEELESRNFASFCSRFEETQIDLNSNLAQIVIGVRRSGKSTICEKVLKQSGVKFAYVNFDDDRLCNMVTEDFDRLLEALYIVYGKFEHLFLDEIQNINNWQLFVNRLLRQRIHIFITGSNSKLLSSELTTHLTGRYNKVELYPFSFMEYCVMKKVDTKSFSVKSQALRKKALHEYLQSGGFPELLMEQNRRGYINSLLDSIIRNDIAKRFSVRNVEALRRMAAYLSDNFSQEFVASTVSKLFGISNHTAENYYSYLKEAFLLLGVKRFSFKSKDRIRNEKVYVVDTAFVTDRDDVMAFDNFGWKLENVVCVELLRRNRQLYRDVFYYKESDYQIDFLIAENGTVKELIQVSYDISSEKTYKREVRGLVYAARKLKCSKLTLITFDEERKENIDGCEINVCTASDWLLNN